MNGVATATMVKQKNRILSTEEAAALLHINKRTLQNWWSENRGGIRQIGYKPGAEVLFFEDELVDWIRQHPGERNEDEGS